MNISDNMLFIDTSAKRAVVGVAQNASVLAEVFLNTQQSHAENLSAGIDEALNLAKISLKNIQAIVVGTGPGSFVGCRIALAHAKGLATGLNVPLVGVGTLFALAAADTNILGIGLAVIDARRNEFFVQKFRRSQNDETLHIESLTPPFTIMQSELEKTIHGMDFLVGNGFELVNINSPIPINSAQGPTVQGLLGALKSRLAVQVFTANELMSLLPEYCRAPDAKTASQKFKQHI